MKTTTPELEAIAYPYSSDTSESTTSQYDLDKKKDEMRERIAQLRDEKKLSDGLPYDENSIVQNTQDNLSFVMDPFLAKMKRKNKRRKDFEQQSTEGILDTFAMKPYQHEISVVSDGEATSSPIVKL